jgi:hypothetical protein
VPNLIPFLILALIPVVGVEAAVIISVVIVDVVAISALVSLGEMAAQMLKGTPKPEAMRDTVRQAIPPRRRGCGIARLGGPFLHDEAHDGVMYRVIAFCDRPCEVILAYLLNQDQVAIDPATNIVFKMSNNAYQNQHVAIETTYGVSGVNAFPGLTAFCPDTWPANAYGTGIFMGYLWCSSPDLAGYPIVFPRGKPQLNVIAKIGPSYDWRDSMQSRTDPTTWKVTANPVVNLVHELWNYRDYDWDADFAPTLSILTAEANLCDAPIGLLNMLAKIVVDAKAGDHSVVIQPGPTPPIGVNFYLAGQTFVVSQIDAYNTNHVVGSRVSWADTGTGSGLIAAIALGSVARWQADATHPVTEPTYACGGAWNSDEQEADTVKRFLESMDGWMARRGSDGAVVIRCGHYYEPTVVISADEVISYTWQPYVEAGKAVNQLVPSFVSPAYDYSQIDTTPMQDDADIALNGLSSQGFQPDLVQSNGQVRRLAKRRLARLMTHVESITLKASGVRALGERYLRIQLPGELEDLADAVVEVVGDYEVTSNGLAVTIPIALTDPDIDAWNPYTDEGPGPASSASTPPPPLSQPSIDTVTKFTDTTGGGTRLKIMAIPSSDMTTRTDLTWLSQWRVSGDTSWVQNRFSSLPAGEVELDTGMVTVGATLDVEVAYQTGAGALSPWSAIKHIST